VLWLVVWFALTQLFHGPMATLLKESGKQVLEQALERFFSAYLESLDFENNVNMFHTLDGTRHPSVERFFCCALSLALEYDSEGLIVCVWYDWRLLVQVFTFCRSTRTFTCVSNALSILRRIASLKSRCEELWRGADQLMKANYYEWV